MKIAVYAICGAAETDAIVERFYRSCRGADYVIVCPTVPGAHGDEMHRINISPFRFDDARNAALAMVPEDATICIALDMDETLELGWREALEKGWYPGDTHAWITFDFDGATFEQNNRVHSRHGWRWKHPCHEALVPSMNRRHQAASIPGVKITHRPDRDKPRPNYLEMLAWGQWEDPQSQRMLYYYGRELLWTGHSKEALERLETYLKRDDGSFPAETEAVRKLVAEAKLQSTPYLDRRPHLHERSDPGLCSRR